MKHLLTLLLTIIIAATATAQCDNFDCAYKAAQRLLNSTEKDKYTKAMAQLEDAENYAGSNKSQYEQVRALRKKAFVAIEKERKDAVEARAKAEIAEKKANAVLDKIYFYDDKFGLAYDKDRARYGFIDKNLNTKIDFEYWEALPFEYIGFAKVKKYEGFYYLIDTTRKEYKLSTDIDQLDNSITALDLRNNDLKNIPADIERYPQLSILLLSKNKLTTLPPEIKRLTKLTRLDLDKNQLTSLPSEIGELNNLKEMNLSYSHLISLPPEIGKLTSLTRLYLSVNQLASLPPEIGNLTQMTRLYLSVNQLASLPPEIGNLSNLTDLNLSNNQLTSLPTEIGKLTQMTRLYLSVNQLASLPPEIGNLTNLTDLSLSDNQLTSLPPEIGNLTNLTGLCLFGNQLTSLPTQIGDLKKLTNLDLRDNPIPPAEQEKIRKLLPRCNIRF